MLMVEELLAESTNAVEGSIFGVLDGPGIPPFILALDIIPFGHIRKSFW